MTQATPSRYSSLDALRGIAIFTMVCANMSGLLMAPHPIAFRFYGSFAAPIFITLSGFFITIGKINRGYGFGHFAARSALLLLTGAAIDMLCFGLMPFVQVDVLYLIGAATPLAYLATWVPKKWVLITSSLVFAVTVPLRQWLGYSAMPLAFRLSGARVGSAPPEALVWKHWLVDGWFPFFPWLGFMLFGVFLAKQILQTPGWLKSKSPFFFGSGLLGAGIALRFLSPGARLTRYGYSEIFYPPTSDYVCLALGVILILARLTQRASGQNLWRYWIALGRASLFFYVLHVFVISFALDRLFSTMAMPKYLAVYLGFISILLGLGQLLARLKEARPRWLQGYFARFLLGG